MEYLQGMRTNQFCLDQSSSDDRIRSFTKIRTLIQGRLWKTTRWMLHIIYLIPYSMYFKPMGDLPYISSEQGGIIVRTELIYKYTIYISVLYLYKNFELKRGVGL